MITSPKIVAFTLMVWVSCPTSGVEVQLPQSLVIGHQRTWNGSPYWAFLGIRYAKAPVGSMRFRASSLAALPATLNATQFGHRCHPIGVDHQASEDCLFVNVFCPPLTNETDNKRAVLVFIHGGGNVLGDPEFVDGGPLATENDLVLVTFNYRVGPLGFLSGRADHSDGNYGLLDQRLALQWTQRYIEYFGGDPSRVTVAGVSAGAKDLSVHTVSTGSRGLFHRAVMLSGTIFGPSLYTWDPVEATRRLAERVNCSSQSFQEVKACLRQVPATLLSRKASFLWPDYPMRTTLDFGWGAVRDGMVVPPNVTSGMFNGEVLLGVNNNEGSMFLETRLKALEAFHPSFSKTLLEEHSFKDSFINQSLYQYYQREPTQSAIEAVYKVYTDGGGNGTMRGLMDLYADQQYVAPALEYLWRNVSSRASYLYYFDHDLYKHKNQSRLLQGSHHADDQMFFLGLVDDRQTYTDHERTLSAWMRIYISNFVKTGNPNTPIRPSVEFLKFFDKNHSHSFLHVTGNGNQNDFNTTSDGNGNQDDFNTAFDVKSYLLPSRMSLWEKTLPQLMSMG